MTIDGFSRVTNRNINDDYNENCEEVQKSSNPIDTNTVLHYKSPKVKIHESCGVLSCKSVLLYQSINQKSIKINQSNDSNGNRFHNFPKDKEERKSWIIECMNPKITTKNKKCKNHFVCGKHFTNDCYPGIGTKNKRLKKGSKPTKYLPSS